MLDLENKYNAYLEELNNLEELLEDGEINSDTFEMLSDNLLDSDCRFTGLKEYLFFYE